MEVSAVTTGLRRLGLKRKRSLGVGGHCLGIDANLDQGLAAVGRVALVTILFVFTTAHAVNVVFGLDQVEIVLAQEEPWRGLLSY